MSSILSVRWTITPLLAPQPWLHCSRCRASRCFRSSDRFRVNANGRRIDAWLIYRCTACDGTWNRPVVERREVSTLGRPLLQALQANDPDLVHRLAFDAASLGRWTAQVREFDEVLVTRQVLSEGSRPFQRLEIECRVSQATGLRADRLLASELGLSRNAIRKLGRSSQLVTMPPDVDLRRPLRDGLLLIIDTASLPEGIVEHAAGRSVPSRPA
ncbi:DUF1062 domain-containing protein [Reyranella sp.]|uniref:DUF1062 domain-containing protein n=1 Tax=Reyranella sp. TaxID=1929291 RepID=UPI003BAC643F